MQMEPSPMQVHLQETTHLNSPNDYLRTSFLADPSTPGYSDGEWKAMAAMQHSANSTSSPFSPTWSNADARPPVTPKTDSFTHSDTVSKHLLVETALLDSSKFDILDIEEVDSLKKEKVKVDARIESARRKLALESKVRDAAQSLHRLYSAKGRPKSQRRQSLLGPVERRASASSNHSDTAGQAEDELAASSKKIDEIVQILVGLENRRQYIESRLLRHTAAVLQAAHAEREADMGQSLQDSGFDDSLVLPFSNDDDDMYGHGHPDGIGADKRGLLSKASQDSRLSDVNMRLQLLNGQLQSLISQAKRGRSASVDSNSADDIPSAYPEDEDAAARLDNQLEHMQRSVLTLVQEHRHMQDTRDRDAQAAKHESHALEGRLESANSQLFNILSSSTDPSDTRPPPEVTGHGVTAQIDYLDETLLTVEQMLQQSLQIQDAHDHLSEEAHRLRSQVDLHAEETHQLQAQVDSHAEETHQLQSQVDSHAEEVHHLRAQAESYADEVRHWQTQADTNAEDAAQFEITLLGLWEILSPDHDDDRDVDSDNQEESRSDAAHGKEPFTLELFSTRVRQLSERANHLDLQTDTLRRQIQQQRDLAGKVEAAELNSRELEDAKASRQEALQELEAYVTRIEEMQDQIEALEAEHRDDTRIAETEAQAKENDHQVRLEELTAALDEANIAKERAEESSNDHENATIELESEIVRLTTELTMAKAELDGAYGSRTDRAKDVANNPEIQAQLSRLDMLSAHNQNIVDELEQLRQDKVTQEKEMQDLVAKHDDSQSRAATLENQIREMTSRQETLEAELVVAQTAGASSGKSEVKIRALEKELAEMANDYQSLTRETVEVEKEREQIEALVDSLRMRVSGLEGHLADEKVKWLGAQRAATPEPGLAGQKEMTSTMVMRTEFKKMMREARAEGVKTLRVSLLFTNCLPRTSLLTNAQAEQEERRKLETLVRSLRRERGALSPNLGRE